MMTYLKIFLLSLFIFSPQVFAEQACIDLSGTYSCSASDGTTDGISYDLVVTQTRDPHNAPILTFSTPDSSNSLRYIADGKIHGPYAAMCESTFFSVISPLDPNMENFFVLSTYVMTSDQELDIRRNVITLQSDENNATKMNVVQNLGQALCTKK